MYVVLYIIMYVHPSAKGKQHEYLSDRLLTSKMPNGQDFVTLYTYP